MNLQQFVQEALQQIVAGVAGAKPTMQEHGASVRVGQAEGVEFDVAVTAVDTAKTKGGIAVVVAAFGVGLNAENEVANTVVSRIRFSVPIHYEQPPERQSLSSMSSG